MLCVQAHPSTELGAGAEEGTGMAEGAGGGECDGWPASISPILCSRSPKWALSSAVRVQV